MIFCNLTLYLAFISVFWFTSADGRDVCLKNGGILRPIATVQLQQEKVQSLAFDVSNLNSYLSQISSDIPDFSTSLGQYSDLGKINTKKPSPGPLLRFSGMYNAIVISSTWRDAFKNCNNRNADLLNFDFPTNRVAALKFMQVNNLAEIPVFVMTLAPYITNRPGQLLFQTNATQTETLAAIYPTLKPDDSFIIKAAPTGEVQVVCLVEIQPILRREPKKSYMKTWARIATDVLGLAGEFKTAYDIYYAKTTQLPLASIEGRQRIVAAPKIDLIKTAKYLSTHQFLQSFDKARFGDLIDLNSVKGVFKSLIRLLTANSNKFILPKEILEINDQYSDISVSGKMTDSDGSTYYAGTGRKVDIESSTPIVQYKYFPISSNKKVPTKGYLVAIGSDAITTGKTVYFLLNYQPIGGNCSSGDNIQHCNNYVPVSVDQHSVDCAKYILGVGPDVNCHHEVRPLTYGRADCGGEKKVLVGTAYETEVSLNCNGNLLKTQILRTGVHSIVTDCTACILGQ